MKRMLLNDNLNEVIRVIFRYFEIDFNDYSSYLYHSHPRYGHFEAMAYILSRNGIDSSLIETDGEEINSLPFPLIINYDGLFLPIIGIDKTGSFVILNESGESETIEIDRNDSGWDKRALVLQKDDKCRSDGKTERTIRTFKQMTVYFSCLIFGIAFTLLSVKVYSDHNLIRDSFLLSSILGLTVSVLFHIQRFNRGNPLVNKICHSSADHSSKRDCSSILDSSASKLFGLISWVDIGSVYFIVFFLVLCTIRTIGSTTLLAIVSLCSVLYIPYSIYYQASIAQRWCTLCLSVQVILLFNSFISIKHFITEGLIVGDVLNDAVMIAAITLVTIPIYSLIINVLNSYFIIKKRDRKNRELIFSTEIIHQLIYETPVIDFATSSKIPVLTREGDTELIMVINPMCSPCIKETREILGILNRKRYTSLSIIFLVNSKAPEEVAQAKMLISESIIGDLSKALTDYVNLFPQRNTTSIISMPEESQRVLDSHIHWCINNNILATPKLFINNHELPSLYSPKDIDFLIE